MGGKRHCCELMRNSRKKAERAVRTILRHHKRAVALFAQLHTFFGEVGAEHGEIKGVQGANGGTGRKSSRVTIQFSKR